MIGSNDFLTEKIRNISCIWGESELEVAPTQQFIRGLTTFYKCLPLIYIFYYMYITLYFNNIYIKFYFNIIKIHFS